MGNVRIDYPGGLFVWIAETAEIYYNKEVQI